MSNSREDFVTIQPVKDQSLSGISTGLPIAGIGTIKWALMIDLHIHHSLYVPQCLMNLLSPQHLAQQTKRANDGFSVLANVGILKFGSHTRSVLLDRASNLPILHMLGHQSALPTTSSALAHLLTSLQVYNSKIDNLSQVQQQLLRVHYRLGHLGMNRTQALAHAGILPKHLASCPKPLCTSCQLGTAHRSATPSIGTLLDVGHLKPSDCVSVDQLESNAPGSVPTSWGLPTKCTYQAAILFCDYASCYLFLTCHHSTGAGEAVAAKRAFEREASLANVTNRKYKADNGIFNSILWKSTCNILQQTNEYCGINAHHQNGIAERQIRSIVDRERTMLLHALNNWPVVITVSLWPYALRLAVDLHNAMPGPSSLPPAEIFAGTKDRNRLADFHAFGYIFFYRRYIDDILGIWVESSKTNWQEFKVKLNQFGTLKRNIEELTKHTNFLDLQISIKDNKIHTKTFQKDMNLYTYIPPLSAHPNSCFKGLITGEILRYWCQNSNKKDFINITSLFIQRLVNQGHQINDIVKTLMSAAASIDNAATGTYNRSLSNQERSNNDNTLYIHWRYHPHDVSKHTIRNVYNATLKGTDGFSQMRIALSRHKNLREILCRSQLDPNNNVQVSEIINSLTYRHT